MGKDKFCFPGINYYFKKAAYKTDSEKLQVTSFPGLTEWGGEGWCLGMFLCQLLLKGSSRHWEKCPFRRGSYVFCAKPYHLQNVNPRWQWNLRISVGKLVCHLFYYCLEWIKEKWGTWVFWEADDVCLLLLKTMLFTPPGMTEGFCPFGSLGYFFQI